MNSYTKKFGVLRFSAIWGALAIQGLILIATTIAADHPPFVEIPEYWSRLGPYGGGMVDLAFAPSDPSIVYCLTGDKTYPLYRSIDGGRTWIPKRIDLHLEFAVTALGVSSEDPAVVLMGTIIDTYQTTDGGDTWRKVYDFDCTHFLFDPKNGQVVYAWPHWKGGIHRSKDAGASWSKLADFSPHDVAIDPYDGRRLAAIDSWDNERGLYLSEDGGATWSMRGFAGQDLHLVAFGKDRNVIYVVRRTVLWRTANNGANWSIIHDFNTTVNDLQVMTGTDEVLYAAAAPDITRPEEHRYSGVYKSTDAGSTWHRLTDGLGQLLYSQVRIDPANPDHLLVSGDGSEFDATFDGGLTWRMPGSIFRGQSLTAVAISPLIAGLILVQNTRDQILRTTDYGTSWHYTNYQKDVFIPRPITIEFSPFDPQQVFAAGVRGIFRSADAGMNWQSVGPPWFIPYAELSASPAGDDLVCVGGNDGQIARTTDGGNSWTAAYDAGDDHVKIRAIEFVPLHPQTAYALQENWAREVVTLLKSDDEGASWREISILPTIYGRDLAVTATDPEILFACNGAYPLRSTDQGLSWEKLTACPTSGDSHCNATMRHQTYVWTSGWYDISLTPDLGYSWRQIPVPKILEKRFLEDANQIIAPDNFPNLMLATKFDGLYAYPDCVAPQILAGGSYTTKCNGDLVLRIYAWCGDSDGLKDIVEVRILIDGFDTGLRLFDDGSNGDSTPNDGIYTLEIPIAAETAIVSVNFNIQAIDKQGMKSDPWPELICH